MGFVPPRIVPPFGYYQPTTDPNRSQAMDSYMQGLGYQPIVAGPHGPPPQSISGIIPFPAFPEFHEAILAMANAGKASLMEEPPNPIAEQMLYADPEWPLPCKEE